MCNKVVVKFPVVFFARENNLDKSESLRIVVDYFIEGDIKVVAAGLFDCISKIINFICFC